MDESQFIRRTRKWARAEGLSERVETGRGKGGHVIQYVGERKTGEIGIGLLREMLRQLGIPREEF